MSLYTSSSSLTDKNTGLVYTRMKIFHFKDKIDSLPASCDKIMAPIHIRIKPTNVCNHSCFYCSYRIGNVQLGKDMVIKDQIPKEKMMEILDDIVEMGVKSVTFSGGGEPFCYPHLLEVMKKLSKTTVKFAALTNGALLKKGEIAAFFAHHASWLRISLDGWDDESYSSYRGVEHGEFTKIMRNIEDFKRYKGKCYLGTVIIVSEKNAPYIYELIKKLKDKGTSSVKLAPCILSNSGIENNRYHRPFFSQAKAQIAEAITDFMENDFEIFDAYHEQLETFDKKYSWCPSLQIVPVIGADLNVYSCHDKAYNLDEGLLGSLKTQRFKDLWFSKKSNFFKINPSLHCNHHCVVNAQNKLILEYLNADKEHLGFV